MISESVTHKILNEVYIDPFIDIRPSGYKLRTSERTQINKKPFLRQNKIDINVQKNKKKRVRTKSKKGQKTK